MRRLLIPALLITSVALAADTGILNWTQPATYTDGTALDATSIAQTNLRCSALVVAGVRTGCSLAPVTVAGLVTSYAWPFTFTDPRGGQICFQAQTQLIASMGGGVSDWSTEACKSIPGKRPSPPIVVLQ
jgi:hypothetical protein